MKDSRNFSLFDAIDKDEAVEKAKEGECKHPKQFLEKTITFWPGEDFDRFTWTCQVCGHVWGRCP